MIRGTVTARVGLVAFIVACSLLAVVLAGQHEREPHGTGDTTQRDVGPPAPTLVGLTRTQVLCAFRDADRRVVVDGRVEDPIAHGICSGAYAIRLDPPVSRQTPAPGTPLAEGVTIRAWTPCFRKQCL